MKLKSMIFVLWAALILSCSGHTIYRLFIDGLSFIPEDQLRVISPVPEGIGLTLYMLPGIHADLSGSGPAESLKRGMEITAPVPAYPPDDVELKLMVECKVSIENMDSVLPIPSSALEVWIAGPDTENVYAQGSVLFNVIEVNLPPLAQKTMHILRELTPVDEDYHLIEQGVFRLGIRLRIEPAAAATVNIEYTLQTIDIEVSGKPIGFLP